MDTIKKNLNENWKFHLGECEEAWYKGYDDRGWLEVMVPHDWSVEHPFSTKYSSGTGYLAGGISWYRLHFNIPEAYKNKHISIAFDGVYKNSQVWCNSYYLGKHPSGYTPFSYDVSKFISFEEENVICVKVVHTDLSDSRWFTGSGITRKVTLIIEEPVHPKEYGIVFQTTYLDEKEAKVKVEQQVCNRLAEKVKVSVETQFWEEEGQEPCLCLKEEIELEPLSIQSVNMSGSIIIPKIWSIQQPALYTMKTFYSINQGEAYQVQEEKIGLRTFTFSADNGFYLNGVPETIKGVCVHHDAGCLGAAVTQEVWQRRLELLKEGGCNAIRCSHNPHMPELYELCDSMGFLVMDEAFDEWENAKNKWSTGHNVYPPKHQGYFEDFPQWHEIDLRTMVRRNRNHPSIIMWSIGNEIDYPNDPYCHPRFKTMTGNNDANKPEAEKIYNPNKPNMERLVELAKSLSSIVKEEDTTRPVTMALAFPELSAELGVLEALDVVGYNYKEHLYEKDHERFPAKPFLGSENSHKFESWKAVTEHPYISGQFLWTGIDYLGEAKGWPVHGSPAGIITTAGWKKTEFYRRKALWISEPVLHLGTQREAEGKDNWRLVDDNWNYESGEKVLVRCYTNLPEVKLFLNNKEVNKQTHFFEEGSLCFALDYEPGVLVAKGYDETGKVCKEYSLETTQAASVVECKLWKSQDIVKHKKWEVASCKTGYLYQLEMILKDKAGKTVTWNDHKVTVDVWGAGELVGIDNGNLGDVTAYSTNNRKTWKGKLTAYVRRIGVGEIHIYISSQHLEGCTIDITGQED